MKTLLEQTGQAFSDLVRGVEEDLFDCTNLTGKQITYVEHSLLTNITAMMYMFSDDPEKSLKDIARVLTEDSLTSLYSFNEETGGLEKFRASSVYREYELGTKATINLNPYIAQYERI